VGDEHGSFWGLLGVFESRVKSINGMETERECSIENITLNMETFGVSVTLLSSRDLTPSLFIRTEMKTAVLTDW
jgi:hypothetical protein